MSEFLIVWAKIIAVMGTFAMGYACWVLYHSIQLSFEILLKPIEDKKPRSCKIVKLAVRIISVILFSWAFIEFLRRAYDTLTY